MVKYNKWSSDTFKTAKWNRAQVLYQMSQVSALSREMPDKVSQLNQSRQVYDRKNELSQVSDSRQEPDQVKIEKSKFHKNIFWVVFRHCYRDTWQPSYKNDVSNSWKNFLD